MNSVYHIAHLCGCGAVYSHSQAECDEHRGHDCINIPTPFEYWMDALRAKWFEHPDKRIPDREKLLQAVRAYFNGNAHGWKLRRKGEGNRRAVEFRHKDEPTMRVWYPTEGRANDVDVLDLVEATKHAQKVAK